MALNITEIPIKFYNILYEGDAMGTIDTKNVKYLGFHREFTFSPISASLWYDVRRFFIWNS